MDIPNECNQLISAGKCLATLRLWYNRGEYDVSLQADPSSFIDSFDNTRDVLLQILTNFEYITYDINRACNDTDDCARDLIKNGTNEMLQRQVNYTGIMDEIRPLISGPSLTPDDPNLNCYDSNQNISPCGTSIKPGSCIILNAILKKTMSVRCDTSAAIGNAYISIDQSDNNYASFNVHCNRSLCNSHSTLQTAKELMFKYSITATLDGRLVDTGTIVNDGSKLMVSILLMIMIFLGLLSD